MKNLENAKSATANKTATPEKSSPVKITNLAENPEALATVLKTDPEFIAPEPKPLPDEKVAPEEIIPTETKPAPKKSADAPKTKTQGIFAISALTDPELRLMGSSSQIEICTRDYMSWCLKGKAPKIMQAEFDRVQKTQPAVLPKDIFVVTILRPCPTTAELKQAKIDFDLNPGARKNDPAPTWSTVKICATLGTQIEFLREALLAETTLENLEFLAQGREFLTQALEVLQQAETTASPLAQAE